MSMSRRLAAIPFIFLIIILLITFFKNSVPTAPQVVHEGIDTGDTAWMLMASALVLIMTPGLAFFYGGMVSKKNVLSTMLQSFICMAIITVLWVVLGF
jgi:ammonium transporter, Amt family